MEQLAFDFHAKKVCSACGQEKPINQFSKSSVGRDGFRCTCKECMKIYCRQYYAQNPEARKRHAERGRQYRIANYDKEQERFRKYYLANTEKLLARCLEYRTANPEKRRATLRKWVRANPDKMRTQCRLRRARKVQAPGIFTAEDERRLYEICNHQCLCCGAIEDLAVDHIVPLTKGGINSIENCQILCRSCNSRKGTQIIDYRPDRQGQ